MATTDALERFLATDYATDLAEANRLSAVEDDEREPYKSKYAAREVLKQLRTKIEQLQASDATVAERAGVLLAFLDLRLGENYVETEETPSGEQHLLSAIDGFRAVKERFPALLMQALSQLAILYNNRMDYERALEPMVEAEKLYPLAYQAEKEAFAQSEADRAVLGQFQTKLEEQYTMIQFYLAQMYANNNKPGLSAKYCSMVLQRQLKNGMMFNPTEWAKNCTSLTSWYILKKRWDLVEYCLRAAESVMPKDAPPPCWPGLHTMWVKFCVARLRSAQPNAAEMEDNEPSTADGDDDDLGDLDEDSEPLFESLELPPNKFDRPLQTYEEAREVFLCGCQHVTAAKQYFVLDGFVSDHLGLLADEGNLWRYLITFEKDPERKLKMHRRRIALFEPLLQQLNPTVYDNDIKQILFDMGDIHADMVDIRVSQGDRPKKVNDEALDAIKYFRMFLKSFEKDGRLPDSYDEGYVQAVLSAQFTLGRMYMKLQAATRDAVLNNIKMAEACFQYIIDYRRRTQYEGFAQEALVAQEMLSLLPMKVREAARFVQ